jgi:hypothetical protein
MATTELQQTRTIVPPASPLENALRDAVNRMSAARLRQRVAPGEAPALPPVDLEALADLVIEAAIRDQHGMVMSSLDTPGKPSPQETGWAQSLAGSVATRFRRTARKVLRSLKDDAPEIVIDDSSKDNGCPAWCVRYDSPNGCDWCESRPIAFHGPGDFYDDEPEQYEVLYAALSEAPLDDLTDATDAAPYIFFDTLSTGQGDRLDVAQTDIVIRRLTRYVAGLQVLRDQLAYLQRD